MKLVHAADLHLDSPLRGLERYETAPVEELRRATRDALGKLVELCVQERAELLLIAGDLFDGNWRDYSTGLFLCEQMARLREAAIDVVWLRGNHDAESRLTKHLKMPANVRELSTRSPESVSFERLDLVVHGQGFATGAVTDDLTRRYPRAVSGALNIGLLHTALDGREGHAPYAPVSVSNLVDLGYQYWALGHIHTHEVVAREPFVVYPGNLQGRHVRETGPKGAVVLEVDRGRVLGVEHRALDVVRFERLSLDVSESGTLDDVTDLVQKHMAEASRGAEQRLLALRVELTGEGGVHTALARSPERVAALVRAAAIEVDSPIWVERVVVRTAPRTDLRALAASGPVGGLIREIEELRGDPGALQAFARDVPGLAELERKLAAALDDPTPLAELLSEAEALLLSRLAEAPGLDR
jgi:DNA repair exonuclease SbcCD nuclease subunit